MVWWSKWDTLIERGEVELVKFKVKEIFIFLFLIEGDRKWKVERRAKH